MRNRNVTIVAVLLTACATQPEPPPESLEHYVNRNWGEQCRIAGYTPGTPAHGNCMVVAYQHDQDARRALAGQLLLNMQNQPQPQIQQAPAYQVPVLRQPTQCMSVLGNRIVTTTCN